MTGFFGLERYRVSTGLCLIILAGCAAPQAQISPPADHATALRQNGTGSWMAPDAEKQDLLYVADSIYGIGSVDVFSYPKGTLKGHLAGVSPGGGLCSDKHGNVFIPAGTSIYEFAHGGTQPIAVLDDPQNGADFCSIDPTTGNLAVSPTVVVYAHAQGSGTAYSGGNNAGNYSCAYDEKGNLFVNGWTFVTQWAEPTMGLVELRRGDTALTNIHFPTLLESGTVMWDGKYLIVGASGPAGIAKYRISGDSAYFVGPWISLADGVDIRQFWIQGKTVVVPSFAPPSHNGHTAVYFYHYPGGGEPKKIIDGLAHPSGVTVSLARK